MKMDFFAGVVVNDLLLNSRAKNRGENIPGFCNTPLAVSAGLSAFPGTICCKTEEEGVDASQLQRR